MVNLITRMVSMEIVWRQCGGWYCYGDFIIKLIRRFSRAFTEKTWLIKLPNNLHIIFTTKSP